MRRLIVIILVVGAAAGAAFFGCRKSLDSMVLGKWTRTQSFAGIAGATETAEFTADHYCSVTLDASVPGLKLANGTKLIEGTWTIEGGQIVVRERAGSKGLLHVGKSVTLSVSPDGKTITVTDSNVAGMEVSRTFRRGSE